MNDTKISIRAWKGNKTVRIQFCRHREMSKITLPIILQIIIHNEYVDAKHGDLNDILKQTEKHTNVSGNGNSEINSYHNSRLKFMKNIK